MRFLTEEIGADEAPDFDVVFVIRPCAVTRRRNGGGGRIVSPSTERSANHHRAAIPNTHALQKFSLSLFLSLILSLLSSLAKFRGCADYDTAQKTANVSDEDKTIRPVILEWYRQRNKKKNKQVFFQTAVSSV